VFTSPLGIEGCAARRMHSFLREIGLVPATPPGAPTRVHRGPGRPRYGHACPRRQQDGSAVRGAVARDALRLLEVSGRRDRDRNSASSTSPTSGKGAHLPERHFSVRAALSPCQFLFFDRAALANGQRSLTKSLSSGPLWRARCGKREVWGSAAWSGSTRHRAPFPGRRMRPCAAFATRVASGNGGQ